MSKRANHEANVRFRKKEKRWEASIQIGYHPDGRRRRISVYGKTRKEVLEKLDQIRQDISNGLNLTDKPTFRQVAELWLAQHRVAESTHKHYEYLLKPILAEFGDCEIASILPYQIETVLIRLSEEHYSNSYISKIKAVLNMVFQKAKINKWIRSNPAADLEEIRSQVVKIPKDFFTLEEMKKLYAALPENRLGDSIRLLQGTGIRLGELLAITTFSFNDDCSVLYIRNAVKQVGGKITIGVPKSKSSIRDIVIPEAFRSAAMRLRDLCKDGGYLWEVSIPGQPCHESHFRKEFKRAVESILGPTSKTPHMMRHGYASTLIAQGVPAEVVQQVLGHANCRVTRDVYIHRVQEAMYSASNAFSRAFT